MIISIDVGIKNLSYCVLCKEKETIYKWDVLDLSSREKTKMLSSCQNKQCGKNATFTYAVRGSTVELTQNCESKWH